MAEQILSTTIQAPGFMGLNRQDSSVSLDSGYATLANNCIIDKSGRIGARKGWVPAHGSSVALDDAPVRAIGELISNAGNSFIVVAGNLALFKLVGSTLTQLTYIGGGVAPVFLADDWQMASLNGAIYLYQRDHDPLVFDPDVSTTGFKRISEVTGYLGTVQSAHCVISAFGRTWSASTESDRNTVQFSDLLSGHVLSTGTSGTLDISSVWPNGADEIMALAAHNGMLMIFGKRQILIYEGASNPSNISLKDTIAGVGCFARDSVIVTGGDIIFLSDSGVRSLARTIQEKSAPMRDISANVRDDLSLDLEAETANHIKAVYSDKEAFYLLSLPATNTVYCFDMRTTLPNGASRVTTWSTITPTAFFYTRDRNLLLGKEGYVGIYEGFLDNEDDYRMVYYTNHFDFGSPSVLKILKKISMTFIGGNGADAIVKYGFDFSSTYSSRSISLGDVTIAEFGVAEYGIGEYTAGVVFDNQTIQAGGSGNVLQLGLETVINGAEISLQKLDCFVKQGRTR